MMSPMDKLGAKYAHKGHPTVEELVEAQGLKFPIDPRELLGNFWPEDEPIEEFLEALQEWRGRKKIDPLDE